MKIAKILEEGSHIYDSDRMTNFKSGLIVFRTVYMTAIFAAYVSIVIDCTLAYVNNTPPWNAFTYVNIVSNSLALLSGITLIILASAIKRIT